MLPRYVVPMGLAGIFCGFSAALLLIGLYPPGYWWIPLLLLGIGALIAKSEGSWLTLLTFFFWGIPGLAFGLAVFSLMK